MDTVGVKTRSNKNWRVLKLRLKLRGVPHKFLKQLSTLDYGNGVKVRWYRIFEYFSDFVTQVTMHKQ